MAYPVRLHTVAALLLSVLVSAALAAQPRYPFTATETEEWIKKVHSGLDAPTPFSYHIHVLFVPGDNSSLLPALTFRQKMIDHFNISDTIPCGDFFYNRQGICMFGKWLFMYMYNCAESWYSPWTKHKLREVIILLKLAYLLARSEAIVICNPF